MLRDMPSDVICSCCYAPWVRGRGCYVMGIHSGLIYIRDLTLLSRLYYRLFGVSDLCLPALSAPALPSRTGTSVSISDP